MTPYRLSPLLALAVLAGSASPASAQGNAPAGRLVGAWAVDAAIGPCGAPPVTFFSAYNTFHAGGTLSDFNWIPTAWRSPGHGVWEHLGRNRFATRFQFFRYDQPPPATATARQDIRTVLTLDASGNAYTAQINARVTTLDGVPVGPPLCGEAAGTRITLD